jgi:signal transduction protein with GAF and PtsI domain
LPLTPRSAWLANSAATGIGLLRTELPFLTLIGGPSEGDHRPRAASRSLAEAAGWPVTVRLLDFTNDNVPPFTFAVAG